jgi:putative transposase
VAYSLSLRNLEEMMAERGIEVDHSSVHRWVIKLVPLFEKAFRRHKRAVGKSGGRTKPTSRSKANGSTCTAPSTSRATRLISCCAPTVTRLLRAATSRRRLTGTEEPETITVDKSGANLAALKALNAERSTPIKVRQNKYLNNVLEQDHRAIKRIIKPMMAAATTATRSTKARHAPKLSRLRKWLRAPPWRRKPIDYPLQSP